MDSLILCKFLRGVFDDFYAEAADDAPARDRLGCHGRRAPRHRPAHRRAPKREFNLLAGWTPAEDTLPERFLSTPLPNDPAAVAQPRALGDLVAEYHRQRASEERSRQKRGSGV